MKNLYFLTLLSVLCCILSWGAQAKVITVDNNEGAGADYSSIGDALAAATSGDSIYVHASSHIYSNISINKRISLFGPGHYPESSGYLPARILNIRLQSGCSGTLITGFKINRIECQVWNVAEDITIENNFFTACFNIYGPNGDKSDGDNWTIRGNVFVEDPGCGGSNFIDVQKSAFGSDNWFIANNIFISKNTQHNTGIFGNVNASTTIINNTIIHRNDAVLFYSNSTTPNSSHALLKNNIIVSLSSSRTDVTEHCTDCIWKNNITYSPTATLVALPDDGNINDTNPSFVNVPDSYAWTYDSDFNVKETSAAAGKGTDGTDLGAFGAGFNFNKHGYPFGLPVIRAFQIENQMLHYGEKLRFSLKATAAESRSN